MALIAAHLNAGHSSVDSVAIGIIILSLSPHLHTPLPPFSPSLISLTVSVDVKHQVYLLTYPSVMWQDCHHSGGDRRSVTSVVSLFPHLLGFRYQPVPLRRQLGVTSLTNIRWGSRPVPWQLWNWLWRRKNTIWMCVFFFLSLQCFWCIVASRSRRRDGLLGTATEWEGDERVKARPRKPPEKDWRDRGPPPEQWKCYGGVPSPLPSDLYTARLLFQLLCLDRVTKTMSVALLLMNNLDNSKQKKSNLLSPAPPPYSWSLLGKFEGPAPPPSSKISWSFDLAWNLWVLLCGQGNGFVRQRGTNKQDYIINERLLWSKFYFLPSFSYREFFLVQI